MTKKWSKNFQTKSDSKKFFRPKTTMKWSKYFDSEK